MFFSNNVIVIIDLCIVIITPYSADNIRGSCTYIKTYIDLQNRMSVSQNCEMKTWKQIHRNVVCK